MYIIVYSIEKQLKIQNKMPIADMIFFISEASNYVDKKDAFVDAHEYPEEHCHVNDVRLDLTQPLSEILTNNNFLYIEPRVHNKFSCKELFTC